MTDARLSGRILACLSCGKTTAFTPANKWRPFCCERCKLSDLGAWASESYRIPAKPAEEDDAQGATDDSAT